MADETQQPTSPQEESKKETVRISLPPGLGGRPGATQPVPVPNPSTTRLKPAAPAGPPDEEAKRETAVMGTPVAAPKPKKDTSRVQVSTAKPGLPEPPRPAMKFTQDQAPPLPAPAAPIKSSAPASAMAAGPSGADIGLSVGAILLSLAVLGYLAFVAFGPAK